MISYAHYSDIGGRPYNEDTVEIRTLGESHICAVLADGLGGHGGGRSASEAAVRRVIEGWDGNVTPASLCELVQEAHREILAMQTPACKMKTTIVILSAGDGRFDWAYAGDSRLYHFTDGSLTYQTKDHSASQIAVLLGQITEDQIRFHEDRSRIFRALGQEGCLNVDSGEESFTPGAHAFLLCSDGFWEYVYEKEMEDTLKRSSSPEEWLERMRKLLRGRVQDGNDNNTAAAVWLTA